MQNRLTQLLSGKPKNLLSIFYTAGFPRLEDTAVVAESLQRAGADMIEIGVPFSDPVADGPVIQASNKTALDNGMTLSLLLEQVKKLRSTVTLPVLLMGYINPILQFGFSRFCKEAASVGIDGLILPDLPLDEYQEDYKKSFDSNDLSTVFLVSPTTSADRIQRIDQLTTGFIYAVSASSTTGAKSTFADAQVEYFKRLVAMKLKNRFMVGFGISNHETYSIACEHGAGAIIGSSFISMLRESKDIDADTKKFVSAIKEKK
jgi:tryptophan synthase alpha chain